MTDIYDMKLDVIKSLAERNSTVLSGIDKWFDDNMKSLIQVAKTEEELTALWVKVEEVCTHGLPGLLSVEKKFSFERLKNNV